MSEKTEQAIAEQLAERDALIAALRLALEQWTCHPCEGTGRQKNDRGEHWHCVACDGTGKTRIARAALALTPTTAGELAAAEREVVEAALALKRADDAAQEVNTETDQESQSREYDRRKAEYDEAVEELLEAAERLDALKAKEVGDGRE